MEQAPGLDREIMSIREKFLESSDGKKDIKKRIIESLIK